MAPNRPKGKKPPQRSHRPAQQVETSVAVGYIHPPNYVAPEFMRCMVNMLVRDAYAHPGRVVRPIEYVSSANVSLARNRVVQTFLDHPSKPEWLLFIDADMTFPDDLLDTLLNAAESLKREGVESPIVGGLCFGVMPLKLGGKDMTNRVYATPFELFPTIFTQDPDNEKTIRWAEYPPDSVFNVHSTGAACLLIPRACVADPRWLDDPHPQTWFRESVLWGDVCSEDHFFCLKAGSLGYPVFVDSRAKTGHVKTWIADEDGYMAQRAAGVEMGKLTSGLVDEKASA